MRGRAADVLELAALVELVDERDRVDGLALRVERERGAVDLRVALAVEVARVEDLADRPDRAGGEHHRPEDGLLGLEVLRRDRGGSAAGAWATTQRRIRTAAGAVASTGGQTAVGDMSESGICRGIREHMFD